MNERVKLHPRHEKRVLAEVETSRALLKIEKDYDLTYGELFVIITNILNRWSHQLRSLDDK